MTIYTTTTTVASNILHYEQERLLLGFHNQIVASQFAQKSNSIPTGEGISTYWHRKIKQSRVSSATSEGSDITPAGIYMTSVYATAAKWAGGVDRTMEVKLTSKHLGAWDEMTDSNSTQAAESLDYQILKGYAQNAYRLRADRNTDYEKNVSTTSDGNAGGTTVTSTSLSEAADFWNGGYVTITGLDTANLSRASYCETRLISDFASGTITCTAFPSIIKSGLTIHVVIGTGISSDYLLTSEVLGVAVRQLKRNKAIRFQDGLVRKGAVPALQTDNVVPTGGGYWTVILDQDKEYDFMKDADWKAVAQYQDKEALLNGQVKKWMGCLFAGSTQSWRETVSGTEAETTGAVHIVNVMGQDSYGISPVAAPGSKAPFGLMTRLLTSEDLGEYTEVSSAASWWTFFAHRSLNSLWNVGVMCGASA